MFNKYLTLRKVQVLSRPPKKRMTTWGQDVYSEEKDPLTTATISMSASMVTKVSRDKESSYLNTVLYPALLA